MKISEIYSKFNIPIFLQTHMFKVASVAEIICRELKVEVNKSEIVQAALVHDLGNIVKVHFEKLSAFFKDENEKDYWKEYRQSIIEKYGKTADEATKNMILEINISGKIFDYLNWVGSKNLKAKAVEEITKENLQFLILPYADSRVSPLGIVSITERADEAAKRYGFSKEESKKFLEGIKSIEKVIFKSCKIKPESITNDSVKEIMGELKDYEIEVLDI